MGRSYISATWVASKFGSPLPMTFSVMVYNLDHHCLQRYTTRRTARVSTWRLTTMMMVKRDRPPSRPPISDPSVVSIPFALSRLGPPMSALMFSLPLPLLTLPSWECSFYNTLSSHYPTPTYDALITLLLLCELFYIPFSINVNN